MTGRPGLALRASLFPLFFSLGASPAGAGSPLLVTVGDVSDTGAVVWVRGFREGSVGVAVAPEGSPPVSAEVAVTRESDLAGKVALAGLRPATRHRYRVTQGGERLEGSFLTAPAPGEPRRVSFLWSGDLGGRASCRHITEGYPIFAPMARLKPDFFVFVGDTTYADARCGGPERVPGYDFVAGDLAGFREKHRYNRADPLVQAFFRSTSVYAIWDDHEVRNDFAGSAEPLMPVGRRAFLEYWPIRPPAEEPTRLYRRFRWGKLLEIFILDTRQYRSPNRDPDGPGKTMLGPAQRRWLIEGVSASTATWKAIVSSVPLSISTGRSARDSWSSADLWGFPQENGTGFAVERDALLRALRDRRVRNLFWLVADVHHAELIRHEPWPGVAFHEFVAGPLSATRGHPRPLDMALNPRSLFGLGGTDNFGEVTIDAGGLTVRIVDARGQVRFTRTIAPE